LPVEATREGIQDVGAVLGELRNRRIARDALAANVLRVWLEEDGL
jgi:hypothetical protein